MSASWNCRLFQPGDEAGIIQLYREVFHLEMSPELWRWMYQNPPAGPAVMVVLASSGRLVGHYGVQPREFWISGRRTAVGFAVGTMVQPEIRSVKALVEMAQMAYAICRERSFPLLYAFPNDIAHKVRCGLLGWKPLPQVIEWDGTLPEVNNNSSGNVHCWWKFPDGLDFNTLLNDDDAFRGGLHNCIRSARSIDFLRWRFFDRPGGEYAMHTVDDGSKVDGYAIVKRYKRDGISYGHILDWRMGRLAMDQSEDLLSAVWRHFQRWEVERVSSWAHSDAQLEQFLARAGLSETGRTSNFCFYDLRGVPSAEWSQKSTWQVEMADSDVY